MNQKLNHTDNTFFTNEQGATLLDRFKRTLEDTQYFDVLVGYFRSSGFYQLYEAIEKVDKTRILVGLGIDENAYQIIQEYQNQTIVDFDSHANTKKQFQSNLVQEIESTTEQDEQLETGIRKFVEFLEKECKHQDIDISNGGNGRKLEIKAYPSKNIHAKVYISRYDADDKEYGSVITGSSNFSLSGLVANREFNVQLKDRRDVDYALEKFEDLWVDSVDISEEFVDAVKNKTWLNNTILPYELYLKLIYEYLQEDINLEENFDSFLPKGYMKLDYQEQAVRQAMKKLDEYNGVFLADVVGLGKTFITAQLLQQLKGKFLVICPPVLKEYWEQSLIDFRVPAKVESLGKLEHIIRQGMDRWDYIIIDEAHRFRNEATQSYADLLDICRGKKIILVTATPLNNTIDDIFAQLKLFQVPKNSTIPGISNLEKFFLQLRRQLANAKPKVYKDDDGQPYRLPEEEEAYRQLIKEVSNVIKEKVLKHVMVRRTRQDVVKYFKRDIKQQGLVFPEMQTPEKIIYKYKGEIETVFNSTIAFLIKFKYARYTPLLYYIGSKSLTEFEKQQQRNVGGFMKGILVKRLESSFFAFKQSVQRFIQSYEQFIKMHTGGTLYISKKVNVYDLLENDDIATLEIAVDDERAQKYDTQDFNKDFLPDLRHDLEILKSVWNLWKDINYDPKLEKFVEELRKSSILNKQRLIIFSESKETGEYLYENLNEAFPEEVMFYSSNGGRHTNKQTTSNHTFSRDLISKNFDPNSRTQENNIRILIATDILAEGVNLHRSNVLINYDLPWNPTRVLQRAGRINRLGTAHSIIHIFNFFPTTQSDEHLGLKLNITNKIQMFHNILGEDAKYLSDGEEVGSQELFDTLNNKKAYTGEDEEGDSELKYLEMMRLIRDSDPELFERIKALPKKARSGRTVSALDQEQLVTFFRLGKLKKFYHHQGGISEEITFFDAVDLLGCDPEAKRAFIPPDKYFHMLESNKTHFELDTTMGEGEKPRGGASNINYIEKRLKEVSFRKYKGFTDSDEVFIFAVKKMLQLGLMAKKTAQKIKLELEQEEHPLQMLYILQKHIRNVAIQNTVNSSNPITREVILSGYLVN